MKTFFRILFISFFFLSCSSDLDFDQVNDLKLKPVIVGNLATFDINTSQLLIGSVELSTLVNDINFEVFNNNYVNKYVTKTEFFFEINNAINRDFKIDINFLNEYNVKLDEIQFEVPAYVPGQLPLTKKKIFENTTLDVLKQTKKLAFNITMLPGIPLTNSNLGSLKMSLSATVYLDVQ